jgi:hypothetical protein
MLSTHLVFAFELVATDCARQMWVPADRDPDTARASVKRATDKEACRLQGTQQTGFPYSLGEP